MLVVEEWIGGIFYPAMKGYPDISLVELEAMYLPPGGDPNYGARTFWVTQQLLYYDILTHTVQKTIYSTLLDMHADGTYTLDIY